jgi:hypothetical protein
LGPIRATAIGGEVGYFRERGAKMVKFYLALDLRHKLIEDFEEMSGELLLEGHIVGAAMVTRFVSPRFEPLVKPIGDQNTVAYPREATLPRDVLGAWKPDIDGRGAGFGRLGEILIEGVVQIVTVEIPKVVIWQIKVG